MKKTVVIFANSVKHGAHCVAGKDVVTKKWYRPVSSEDGCELSDDQVKYRNKYGTYSVKPLQKIEMSFENHVPLVNQPENYKISSEVWRQRYSIDIQDVVEFLDHPADLWGKGKAISADSISKGEVQINNSLYLVQVNSSKLYSTPDNKRRIKFIYNDIDYDLPVTDPNFDKIKKGDQIYHNILCVSLGERYSVTNMHYKIVASIL